jgi:hypothetical protein
MAQYEIRSYKKPLLKGHQPIPLEPLSSKDGVSPIDAHQVMNEATRLFSHAECWHITINGMVIDGQSTLRSVPHWCASVEQVQIYFQEIETW